jgi:predicted metal-dependent phosphoesterase TrpH
MRSQRILAALVLAAGIALGTLTDRPPSREPITVEGYQVLSGDFHVHAFIGDGGIAPWMLQRHAARVGLDVIAVTNHNQTTAGRLGRWASQKSSGPMILVGEEITGRNFHLIGVGIEQPVNWNQSARGAIADVHAQGGVAIAAHPLHGFSEGYNESALAELDGVEAAHPDSEAPGIAAQFEEFYQRALTKNPEVAAIGSSDFHTSGPMGLCRTYLLVRERSTAGVIDAIRDGRTVARCETSELHGRPELVTLLEPYRDALAPPDDTAPQQIANVLVWLSLVALAMLGTRDDQLTRTSKGNGQTAKARSNV